MWFRTAMGVLAFCVGLWSMSGFASETGGHCGDTYTVTVETEEAYEFWEFNLRFKTDGSENGPVAGHPVIIPASMRGDRAFVIFAAPTEISPFIKSECSQ